MQTQKPQKWYWRRITFRLTAQSLFSDIEEAGVLLIERGACGTVIVSETEIDCFISDEQAEAFLANISDSGLTVSDQQVLEEQNYLQQCSEVWKAVTVGELLIKPVSDTDTRQPVDSGRIFIHPDCGFGTGHHTSTQQALLLLQSSLLEDSQPQRILDFGTGSGILAVACCSLFNCSVDAIDIDRRALKNAKVNLALNRLEQRIIISDKPLHSIKECYDLITANLYCEVLCSSEPMFRSLIKPGGYLILAGIIAELYPDVLDSYRDESWSLEIDSQREGWSALLLRRTD